MKNNKLSYKHQDEEENQEDNERLVKSRYNSRVPPRHHKGKSSGERRSSSLGLKRPEQIMKERRRKSKITAYQTHRHEENAKKKEYAGKAKGSARNGNHNKRR